MIIRIATDFTETPGARYRNEGDFSGEEFRESLLEPRFLEAKSKGEQLTIDLDGGYGYPTSFLEEAFGGLAVATLVFISRDEPSLIDEIQEYITSQK